MDTFSFREEVLRTFQRENRYVVWQPRLEHWYNVNRGRGTLPPDYVHISLLDLYRNLHASVRYYYGEGGDISSPKTYIHFEYTGGAAVEEVREGDAIHVFFRSPKGELYGKKGLGEWGYSWHYLEHPVKKIEDLDILEYIVTHTRYRFDQEFYARARQALGDLGEIQFYWERSPFQRLFLQYAGIDATVAFIYDYPERLRTYLRVAEEAEDALYEVLTSCPVQILNFGENVDGRFDSPRIYEEYLLPYYEKRVAQIHRAGKFCHIHIDGAVKPLLPYLKYGNFDGIEGLTPIPQGDVSLEELREAMGDDLVLIDGIPMLYFLPDYPVEDLIECTERVLQLFAPRLILGISDEISPPGDIERVRVVSAMVEKWNQGQRG
ncbi:MAG: uroporphyrinogen decarboxylase family protein [Atribacterota bacterium]